MTDTRAKEVADLISLKLLATIKHTDYEWLIELLKNTNDTN